MFQPDKLADLISKPAQKADPFSLASLVEWLERQDGEITYCYISNGACLIARYLKGVGHQNVSVGGFTVDFDDRKLARLPRYLDKVAQGLPHTFGAALQRARNLLSEGKE